MTWVSLGSWVCRASMKPGACREVSQDERRGGIGGRVLNRNLRVRKTHTTRSQQKQQITVAYCNKMNRTKLNKGARKMFRNTTIPSLAVHKKNVMNTTPYYLRASIFDRDHYCHQAPHIRRPTTGTVILLKVRAIVLAMHGRWRGRQKHVAGYFGCQTATEEGKGIDQRGRL